MQSQREKRKTKKGVWNRESTLLRSTLRVGFASAEDTPDFFYAALAKVWPWHSDAVGRFSHVNTILSSWTFLSCRRKNTQERKCPPPPPQSQIRCRSTHEVKRATQQLGDEVLLSGVNTWLIFWRFLSGLFFLGSIMVRQECPAPRPPRNFISSLKKKWIWHDSFLWRAAS